MFQILLTSFPMIQTFHLETDNIKFHIPDFVQTVTENNLLKIIQNYDGWIVGDDPVNEKIIEKGVSGKLKAVVKWGVGIDNVDVECLRKKGVLFTNIPNVFGEAVSDVGVGMLLSLNRRLHNIHQEIMVGNWFKPCGVSLVDKKVCLIGFGDVGQCSARKLLAFRANVYVYDPNYMMNESGNVVCRSDKTSALCESLRGVHVMDSVEKCLENCHVIFITASLNDSSYHLLDEKRILLARKGVKIINVSRGKIICETSVIKLLEKKFIDSVGLDVFENEPLSFDNPLRCYPLNIFGTHNASKEMESVLKTNSVAISKMMGFLKK